MDGIKIKIDGGCFICGQPANGIIFSENGADGKLLCAEHGEMAMSKQEFYKQYIRPAMENYFKEHE